jgi:glucan phosphoethanolaminetransferase (alkaline phosphatase superfamily)
MNDYSFRPGLGEVWNNSYKFFDKAITLWLVFLTVLAVLFSDWSWALMNLGFLLLLTIANYDAYRYKVQTQRLQRLDAVYIMPYRYDNSKFNNDTK